MDKKVSKISNGLRGEITIPADKSISHRAVMFASLAKGASEIKNFSKGADCRSTLEVFAALGVEHEFKDEKTLIIRSQGVLKQPADDLYCGNSGTTMRLMSGILAGQEFNSVLTGDESLSKRPMRRVIEPLSLMGAEIEANDFKSPLKIRGKNLQGINYVSKLASAQVKSCIILAGLNAEGETIVTEPHLSRDHTEKMLAYLGADIISEGLKTTVRRSQLTAKPLEIPGDISSAAFFIVAALITEGSDIILKNVGLNPTRTGILDVAQQMGGNIEILDQKVIAGEEVGDLRVRASNLQGCVIEGDLIPRLIDELPVIAVLATQAQGETIVRDAQDLRNKESDRIAAVVRELRKLGAQIEEREDGFVIRGKTKLQGGAAIDTYHDHRLAMSAYVAGLICEKELLIKDFEWVGTSFPEFEALMSELT